MPRRRIANRHGLEGRIAHIDTHGASLHTAKLDRSDRPLAVTLERYPTDA